MVDEPALNEDVPPTVRAPLSVIAPVLRTARLPVTADVPRCTAPVALTETLAPVSNSAPVNALEVLVRLTLWPVATTVVVPPILSTPVSVTAPADEVTDRLPVSVLVPSTVPVVAAFTNEPAEPVIETAPVNFEAASVNAMALVPAFRVVVPATVQLLLPLSEIAPVAVTARFPVAVTVSRVTGPVAANVRLLPVSETLPVKTFVVVPRLMALPVAVTDVTPVICSLPLLDTAPVEVTVRLPAAVIAPRLSAPPLTRVTASPTIPTAPVNRLPAWFKVTALPAPAFTVVVPPIVNSPVSVTAPVAVTDNAPVVVIVFRIRAPAALTVRLLPV